MPSLDFKGKAFVYAHHLTVPFRELVPDAEKSSLPKGTAPALDSNLIIHGDNLHALKALLPLYAGKIDCIFIDPPYNTGNEGWRYNDNVRSPVAKEWFKNASPVDKEDLERHDKWASMMWPRLKLLHELLSPTGSIWVTLDDNEIHHARSILDEIFGEDCCVGQLVWQKRTSREIRVDLKGHVNAATETIFRELLIKEKITFRLEATNDPKLNWELAETLTLNVATNDHTLQRKGGLQLERHLFEVIYQKQLNGLEQNLAWYLDADKAVKWWHRIAVQQDWHLQGWQRQKVYPDFLACLELAAGNEMRFAVLETKGMHLKGNDDTDYKKKLFDLLTAHASSATSAGELKLGLKKSQLKFELLMETDWQQKIPVALA